MTHKIVFVVAHPDDESLWIGGLLNFLVNRNEVDPYVICITGRHDPYRFKEFEEAMNVIGLKNWSVQEEDIPQRGGIPLSNPEEAFYKGLDELNLALSDIDLLITHPFYGDEHLHLQHVHLFDSLHYISNLNNIPFGFFSTCTIPYFKLTPLSIDMRRDGKTHLINFCLCEGSYKGLSPSHFFQFKIDGVLKNSMLKCYESLNQEEHQRGYASWDSHVEGLYVLDSRGTKILEEIQKKLNIPAEGTLF